MRGIRNGGRHHHRKGLTISNAVAIYQAHLDATSEALWKRDYPKLTQLLICPHTVTAEGETRVFQTPDQVIEGARYFREAIMNLGATAYHRVALSATFSSEEHDEVQGSHRVYILRGGSYIVDPYETTQTLVLDHGQWRSSEIEILAPSDALSAIRPIQCVPKQAS